MALVGKKAPLFDAAAVINGDEMVEHFSLEQYLGKKYVVFFFYPLDFTFVCPTELHAFQAALSEFEKRDTAVVACSVDSVNSHFSWLQMPKDHGGIQGVTYPVVADLSKTISMHYGVLGGDYEYDENGQVIFNGVPQAYRGLFLINKEGVVMHELINHFPLGRNVNEALRMVDALRHLETHGEVCPANWEEGKEAMTADLKSTSAYLASH
jgi:peroxiredoxin 2/4